MLPTDFADDETRRSLGASTDQITAGIKKSGIQVIAVSDVSASEYRPFVYTIGFHDRGLPELIAFADSAQKLDAVGNFFYQLARRNHALTPGDCLNIGGKTLMAVSPGPEFDPYLQEQCVIEARAYYGVDRLDLLVVVEEHELIDPAGLH